MAPVRRGRLRAAPIEEETSPPFAPGQPESKSAMKVLIWPLLVASALKVWSLVEFHKANQLSTPYLMDQLGQLIVIVCIIVLCANMGRKA